MGTLRELDADELNHFRNMPFEMGGRKVTSCDCFGLIELVYKNRYEKVITPFLTEYTDPKSFATAVDGHFKLLTAEGGGWKEAETPYTGCVAVMKNEKGEAVNLGIYIHKDMVLTTNKIMGHSQFVPSSTFRYIGYYEPIE